MNNAKKLRLLLNELYEAAEKVGAENGPDADYRRAAQADANKVLERVHRWCMREFRKCSA